MQPVDGGYITTRLLLPLLAMLPLSAVGAATLPSQAGYFECHYHASPEPGGAPPAAVPRVLKFMLNTRLKKAFRIDTRVARRVEILVSQQGVINLMDYDEDSAVSLVTIQPDGRSVYSFHRLVRGAGEGGGSGMGGQFYGRCRQFSEYAGSGPVTWPG